MSISAIARHLGRDRKTIQRLPGRRPGRRRTQTRRSRSVRGVRRLCPCTPHRGSASVGGDLVRRGRRARLRPVVSTFTRQLRARVCGRTASLARRRRVGRTRRSSIRRVGRPSGTGSSCRTRLSTGVGQERAPAGRCARLQSLARHPGGDRGPGPSGRRPGQDPRKLGGLTRKWRFDRARSAIPSREGDRDVRCGRRALRRAGRDLPAAAGQP